MKKKTENRLIEEEWLSYDNMLKRKKEQEDKNTENAENTEEENQKFRDWVKSGKKTARRE